MEEVTVPDSGIMIYDFAATVSSSDRRWRGADTFSGEFAGGIAGVSLSFSRTSILTRIPS